MKKLAALVGLLAFVTISNAQDSAVPAQSGDAEAGEKIYFLCVGCHGDKPEHQPTGPHLFNIIGRQAGVLDDFQYSAALSASGIFWDERTLDEFIANPTRRVPGAMMVVGVSNKQERADLIEYLKTFVRQ